MGSATAPCEIFGRLPDSMRATQEVIAVQSIQIWAVMAEQELRLLSRPAGSSRLNIASRALSALLPVPFESPGREDAIWEKIHNALWAKIHSAVIGSL